MNKLFKVCVLGLVMVFVHGCTDLEEDLQGTLDESSEGGYRLPPTNVNGSTPADGVGSAFSALFNGTGNHGGYFSISEISTDEAVITQKGGDWFDGGVWLRMHQHTWTATHPNLLGTWNNCYDGINESNRIFAEDGIAEDSDAGLQVRAVRAYYYWRLLDLFGRVRMPSSVAEATTVAQLERSAGFDKIEAELLDIIPDLPAGVQDYGRVSQSGARALLARMYLNAEVYTGTPRWQDAIDQYDAIINEGAYALSPGYAEIFAADNVENMEHIWVVPFDEATATGFNLAQMTLHYPSQLTYNLAQQPWNGYSTLEEFYNSYDPADERFTNNFISGPQFSSGGQPLLDVAFDAADPDGAPVNYTPDINELFPNGSRQAGARIGKFQFKQNQLNDMDNDYPLFRYTEVLLGRAEANARLNGNWNLALPEVNQIRQRAGVADLTSLDADSFLAEKGREMFAESTRRTDLIRFGKWGDAWWEKPAHSDDFRIVFPIPQDQINNSNGLLTQNTGY